MYPLGIESSIVNISALPGSPLTTAIFAPLGNTAGAGPHVSVVSLLVELAWPCSATVQRSRQAESESARIANLQKGKKYPRPKDWF